MGVLCSFIHIHYTAITIHTNISTFGFRVNTKSAYFLKQKKSNLTCKDNNMTENKYYTIRNIHIITYAVM